MLVPQRIFWNAITVTRVSSLSGRASSMTLDITIEQFARFEAGDGLIQNIFPDLNADEREFILTGITASEWAAMGTGEDVGDDEDDT